MEFSLRFNKDSLPLYVYFLVLIKVCYVAFMTFFVDVSNSSIDMIFYSRFIADNFAWMPMMIFFVYFYLYRVGKVSNIGLKNAVICALLAIIPKFIVLVIMVNTYLSANFFILVYYILEFLTWLFLGMYLIGYWKENFQLTDKEKRHNRHGHHHHHYHHRDLTAKGSVLGRAESDDEPRYFNAGPEEGSSRRHRSHSQDHHSHHSHSQHSHSHHSDSDSHHSHRSHRSYDERYSDERSRRDEMDYSDDERYDEED